MCTQTLPLPWEVERLFSIDPRLKKQSSLVKEVLEVKKPRQNTKDSMTSVLEKKTEQYHDKIIL